MTRSALTTYDRMLAGQRILIRREDCLLGMQNLAPASIDVVVTSPPYNLGIDYGTYDDSTPRPDYLAWTRDWGTEVRRVLSDAGSLFLNIGGKPRDPWVPFDVAQEFRNCGFKLQNHIHWIKSIAIENRPPGGNNGQERERLLREHYVRGHYQPVNSARFLNACHEHIYHLTKTGDVELDRGAIGVPYKDKTNIGRWSAAGSGIRCRGNTWFIPYETIQSRALQRPHPASFPSQLPEMCIRLHGLGRVTTVMDPFLGIGSTAVAAVRLQRDFIGFEIDPGYFATSCERTDAAIDERDPNRVLFPD